jgi:calcineurin-like phosphoesterase family protein
MYKHLYDKFKDWYHEGGIWLYSDPHFSDEEMKYLRKNYIGDEEQVKCINSKVGKNDTLIILGDIGDIEYVRQLRGYKVLIMGNHDKGARNYYRQKGFYGRQYLGKDGKYHWNKDGKYRYDSGYNGLFDEVYEGPLFISERIVLSHEPIAIPFAFNIHGHNHNSVDQIDRMHCIVCAHCIDFTLINLKWIIESGIMKDIPSLHRMTIDGAITCQKLR